MAIKKRPVSPRQKMINLMYVVLMAMLALNVSNEVLNGFSIVEESLKRTTVNSANENLAIYDDFAVQMKKNPQKVEQWYNKSQKVKHMSDSLYNMIADLKAAIVREADGANGDVSNIRNKEDLEAANQVMLAPGRGQGKKLFDATTFDIVLYDDGACWKAEMTPKRRDMKRMFSQLVFRFDKKTNGINHVEFIGSNNDVTSIRFEEMKMNEKVDDKLFIH